MAGLNKRESPRNACFTTYWSLKIENPGSPDEVEHEKKKEQGWGAERMESGMKKNKPVGKMGRAKERGRGEGWIRRTWFRTGGEPDGGVKELESASERREGRPSWKKTGEGVIGGGRKMDQK